MTTGFSRADAVTIDLVPGLCWDQSLAALGEGEETGSCEGRGLGDSSCGCLVVGLAWSLLPVSFRVFSVLTSSLLLPVYIFLVKFLHRASTMRKKKNTNLADMTYMAEKSIVKMEVGIYGDEVSDI